MDSAALAGNSAALPRIIFFVIVGAGFGEETIWRGFLFERLRSVLGRAGMAQIATIAVTSILFGAAHLHDQGWPGAVQATISGLVFGTAFARLGRIWPVIIAHAALDLTAVLFIYSNLEEPVSHLIWR